MLEVGDRFPNVLLRRDDGTQSLYNAATGKPVLLGWGEAATARGVLLGVAAALDVEPLWLTDANAPAAPQPSALETGVRALSVELLAPAELKTRVIGQSTTQGMLLLDPALRVLVRLQDESCNGDAAIALLRQAMTDAGIGAGDRAGDHAPVLAVPRVLEPELIARVLAWFRSAGEGKDSGVIVHEHGTPVFRLDPGVKMRREARIEDPALDAEVHDRLMRRVLPEIARAFAFEVRQREAFKVLRYGVEAGYFRPHRDNDAPDVAHRRFAMTLNLNSGEYAGGRLRFPEFGPREYEAATGGALIFSCSLLHEVTDLTAGTRYAMTSFFS